VQNHVQYVIVDRMNLYAPVWNRIQSALKPWNPELISQFYNLKSNAEYDHILRRRIAEAATVPVEFCF